MRKTLWFSVALVVLATGCAKKLEGPAPSVTSAAPGAVCNAQLDTPVTVKGSNFSPVVVDSLTDGRQLVLPKVSLVRKQDLSGASAGGTTLIPDDPSAADQSLLRWKSAEEMVFTVNPDLKLEPGLYDVQVANESGGTATLSGSVLSVPPPTAGSLNQDIACGEQQNALVLSGQVFLQGGGVAPTVNLGDQSFTPSSLDGCTALPGTSGLQSCTSAQVDLPAGTLAPGDYAVQLVNPDPASCHTEEVLHYTVFSRPHVNTVEPLGVCTAAAQTVLTLNGDGFLVVDGTSPTLQIGAQTFASEAGGCTDVMGTLESVQTCTSLTLTLPADTLTPGSYPVTVTNPAPVDCASTDTFTLEVSPPPTIADVQPTAVCSGAAEVTITGTGFQDGAVVTMNGINAESVMVTSDTTAIANFAAGVPTGGPFAVTLDNPDGCGATSNATVQVIPGPQIFFVDPNIAFNGISVQATVYGAGFTGAVQQVNLIPSGGGTATQLSFNFDPTHPNQVQVVLPKGLPAGKYDVALNDTTNCTATLNEAITVVDQPTLSLGMPAMVPSFGWVGESTPVSVQGVDFAPVPRLYLNPANPGPNTVATAVGAVTFLDSTRLTALVPTPRLPVGDYDLIVVNPDGKVGVATAAFTVTQLPPPSITSLSPGSVPNQNPEVFTVNGKDFRQPVVALQCLDAAGVPLASNPTAQVVTSTATSIQVSFDASMAGAACVVRVTDGDNLTFVDFSALVITNPAQNLYAAKQGPNLATARRTPVVLKGDATTSARYLHVIGGNDGTNDLSSIESSALSLLGDPQPFFTQRNALNQPRAFAQGTSIGRWLYVAGGSNAGAALDTVERAYVLDPSARGEVTDLVLEASRSTGLGAGVWYYRVAAVMASTDPYNPDGENLASDPFPVQLPDLGSTKFNVTVGWKADPGAVKYRIYRSPTAGATVGTEQPIAEVAAPATSFVDTGAMPISTDNPLPIGSTGKWQVLPATLSTPREGAAVSWGLDPADPTRAYLYVLGGRTNATTARSSYEYLPITLGAGDLQTPAAAFVSGVQSLPSARWQASASQATNALSSRIPPGTTYVYVLSGVNAAGTMLSGPPAAGLVQAGGELLISSLQNLNRAGYGTVVAGNHVFAFGGNNAAPDQGVVSGEICGPGVSGCGPLSSQVPPNVANWNSGQTMLTPRYLLGAELSGAYIYVAGGESAASPLMVENTLEYRLW